MREVEVFRFVQATPVEVRRHLSPAAIVEHEGSFTVGGVEETPEGTVVTAVAAGLGVQFRFEETDDGYYYSQEGDAGPFDHMETWVSIRPEDEGSRVTFRSAVSLALPLPLVDRIAGWKRKGELERALTSLARDVE